MYLPTRFHGVKTAGHIGSLRLSTFRPQAGIIHCLVRPNFKRKLQHSPGVCNVFEHRAKSCCSMTICRAAVEQRDVNGGGISPSDPSPLEQSMCHEQTHIWVCICKRLNCTTDLLIVGEICAFGFISVLSTKMFIQI